MGRIARLTFLLCVALLIACDRLKPPEQSGELVVAIRNGAASYRVENGAASGFEHDLIKAYAESRHLSVRYVIADDQNALREMVLRNKVHFAASARIDEVPGLLFTAPISETDPILVGSGDNPVVQDEETALEGMRIETMFASLQAEELARMAGSPPRFTVIQRSGVTEFDLLQSVSDRRTDLAATDTLQYRLALQLLPDLEVVRTLPGQLRFGWAFRAEDQENWQSAQNFIEAARRNGLLARLRDRYFGHIERIKPNGIAKLLDDIRTTLPHFRKDFQDAQAASGIDWRLLAALAYQESKWDPNATSPTGVRGMMMLTEETADHLKVDNRLDPKQSIRAGAKYFAELHDNLPDTIPEPDRQWLALAAYNLGMGHMNGARAIAAGMKRDPNSWYEMKKVLPLMAKPEVYSHLKSGPARGGEAVIMTENIRTFYDILSHFEPAWQPTLKPYKPDFRLR